MEEKIRVLIADDHPLFREGVKHTLTAEPDIAVVAEAEGAEAAVALAKEQLPDIALLDVRMPGGGVDAARAIAAACPVTRIVMLTVSEAEEDVAEALRAGARAYIVKGISGRELVRIVRAVHAGEVYVTPELASRLLVERSQGQAKGGVLDELTQREAQILQLVAAGLTNREIGQRLFLSEKTVKHYMTNILTKLHVRSRVEAALLASSRGPSALGPRPETDG